MAKKSATAELNPLTTEEQIAANTERVRTLTLEGKADGAAELYTETEALISGLSGTGVTKRRKEARDALNAARDAKPSTDVATPGKSGTTTTGAEIATRETLDYKVVPGLLDLNHAVQDTIAKGVKAQEETATLAKQIGAVILTARTTILNADELPALDGDSSRTASEFSSDAFAAVLEKLSTDNERDALRQLRGSTSYHLSDLTRVYIRGIGDHPEEWAKYETKIFELNPALAELKTEAGELDKPAILLAHYKLDAKSKREKAVEREANKRAELRAMREALEAGTPPAGDDDSTTGEGSGSGTSSPRKTPLERGTAKAEKAAKDLDGLPDLAKKLTTLEEIEALEGELTAAATTLFAVQQTLLEKRAKLEKVAAQEAKAAKAAEAAKATEGLDGDDDQDDE